MSEIANTVSEIPCCECGGPVYEFTVPNKFWNMVIRKNGPETDSEYLCIFCFCNHVTNYFEDNNLWNIRADPAKDATQKESKCQCCLKNVDVPISLCQSCFLEFSRDSTDPAKDAMREALIECANWIEYGYSGEFETPCKCDANAGNPCEVCYEKGLVAKVRRLVLDKEQTDE